MRKERIIIIVATKILGYVQLSKIYVKIFHALKYNIVIVQLTQKMWHFIRLFMGLKTPLLKSNIWLSIPVKISCKYELRFKIRMK